MIRVAVAVWAAVAAWPLNAQPGAPVGPEVLLSARFTTPLTYEAALTRLDAYYQEQVGRKVPVALPLIAPHAHFDTWHDMWVRFAPEDGHLTVTIERNADETTERLAKGWIVELAGRIEGDLPVEFKELPPLRSAGSNLYGSRKDVVSALRSQHGMTEVANWRYPALIVSSSPMVSVVLAPSGLHGMHRLTVTAESAATARRLATKITAATAKPCICAVYSEENDIEEEIRRDAEEASGQMAPETTRNIYLTPIEPKAMAQKLRATPDAQKRMAGASGYYGVKYRLDREYAKVSVRWAELTGYSRESGKFAGERALGSTAAQRAKPGVGLTARKKLDGLKQGAYRLTIEAETLAGKIKVDERDFWFDGKIFEEL